MKDGCGIWRMYESKPGNKRLGHLERRAREKNKAIGGRALPRRVDHSGTRLL